MLAKQDNQISKQHTIQTFMWSTYSTVILTEELKLVPLTSPLQVCPDPGQPVRACLSLSRSIPSLLSSAAQTSCSLFLLMEERQEVKMNPMNQKPYPHVASARMHRAGERGRLCNARMRHKLILINVAVQHLQSSGHEDASHITTNPTSSQINGACH